MKKSITFVAALFVLIFASVGFSNAFSSEKINAVKNDTLKLVVPEGWPKPNYDFTSNPITRQTFELGRKLFYDPILSEDSTISCSSCHLNYTNFTHVDHKVSHGIKGLKGTRNSLTLVNLAWSKFFMWDGGVNHIEVQPLAPIQSSVEMNSSLNIILPRLERSAYYREKFKAAYGKESKISSQNFLKALAGFMLALQSYDSKYDKVKRGEPNVSFSEAEARGYELFKVHCNTCHTEPLFTNNGFENNGLEPDRIYADGGRIKITGKTRDSLKFKVPSLRNVELSYHYMHDGRYGNLQMVLFHYNHAIANTINLSPLLKKPMNMSEQDKNDVIAFLKTLTDEGFVRNPEFGYPKD